MKISRSIRRNADFKGYPKRGTDSILSSPHYIDMRTRYMRDKLESNFFGPKEWHLLASKKRTPLSTEKILNVSQQIKRNFSFSTFLRVLKGFMLTVDADAVAPSGLYPYTSGVMKNKDINVESADKSQTNEKSEHLEKWEQLRFACANLYPSSVFAIEERVIDSWNYFTSGQDTRLEVPKFVNYGGYRISLVDNYQRRSEAVDSCPDGVSPDLFDAYRDLVKHCNPFQESHIHPHFLSNVILDKQMVRTEQDAKLILPDLILKWRQLCMGNIQPRYSELDTYLSDKIIQILCENGASETALHMIRFKAEYKLNPSLQAFTRLFSALALRHFEISKDPLSKVVPAYEEPVEKKAPKRKVSRKEFPYRQGPRFYFYQKLPFVLSPEPPLFSEFQLPHLPTDNETKRLLPDDQRLKLHLLQEEAAADFSRHTRPESKSVESLTDLYRLYGYVTSTNPYYYGTDVSTMDCAPLDYILAAGAFGGSEKEGYERNGKIVRNILDGMSGEKFGITGVSSLAASDCFIGSKDEGWMRRWDQYGTVAGLGKDRKDTLKIGYLSGVFAVKSFFSENEQKAVAYLSREIEKCASDLNSNSPLSETDKELRQKITETTRSAVEEVCRILREKGHGSVADKFTSVI